MILIFGPAGSGKSLQGKILAARYGWRWLSTGQQLRESGDPEIIATMKAGKLIPSARAHEIMDQAFMRSQDVGKLVLDGFPRMLEEAKWLVENADKYGQVSTAIVLDVSVDELRKRIKLRGRADDTEDAIKERFRIYEEENKPILDYLESQGIKVVNIDGMGSVGEIHDRIVEQVEKIL